MDSATSNIIAVAAEWRAQPGQEETVRQLMVQAAAAVRQHEPGNLLYMAHQDPADPAHFFFYEQYADQKALDAHRDSAHYQELVLGKIVPLLAERRVTFYALLS
ncbi:MAG: antibiotic biosynthesis monooxygenase [Hymenobacter sp.]|nr:MAG: antibiotic biosynthesis monooxygenase [Hymenobacter sp.]